MDKLPIHHYLPKASRIIFGCMGLGGGWNDDPYGPDDVRAAELAVEAALEAGINFFDHADIYMKGKAERVFGQVLRSRPGLREQILIQSKGGIRLDTDPPHYDFSPAHLAATLDGTLERLGIEQLDVWLLHRPDPLMEPETLAELFSRVHAAGKVRFFGVSNMHLHHIHFLQEHLALPLIANQVEMSLHRLDWLHEGVMVANPEGKDVNFTSGTLEYCRRKGIQLQSWGSLAQGRYSGRDVSDQPEAVRQTAALVTGLAEKYETSPEAILLAFLMRHPAGIQPVIGTSNPERIAACGKATGVTLSRQDWYTLYISAYGRRLP